MAFIQVANTHGAVSSSKNHNFTAQELKQYEGVKYGDLQEDPKNYVNIEKIAIDLQYVGEMENKYPFQKFFSEKTYYFLRIPSVDEKNSLNYGNNSYDYGNLLPFIISKMKRENTIEYISKLGKNTPIKAFGRLKGMPKIKDSSIKVFGDSTIPSKGRELNQRYYFIIDDVFTVAEYESKMAKKDEAKVEEPVKEPVKEPTVEAEVVEEKKTEEKPEPKKPVEEEQFQDVNPKNLDILAGKYQGKRIGFKIIYRGRKNEISFLSDKFPGEKYFELERIEEVKLPIFFVIVEKNEANIQKFVEVEEGQEVEISGILHKLEKDGDVIYYIVD